MLGLNRYKVAIADPNPEWQKQYELIASQIRAATAGLKLEIEHIGSTSVPGLAAKPIIDVGILLADAGRFDDLTAALTPIRLVYRGDKGAAGGRLFIRERETEFRTHHIHVYFAGASEWGRYITFRDRLTASPSLREEYSSLKRELAERYRNDRFAYTDAKSEFVARVLSGP